jgi:hypothetical protein
MTTEAVLRALNGMAEAPWNDLKGKPLNERGLAHRLRQYGLKPKVIRVGEATPRGYTRESFHDAWQSYLPLPSAETSATSATSATSGEKLNLFNAENVADADETIRNTLHTSATRAADVADRVADVADDRPEKPNNNSSVSDVADVALVPEAQGDNRNGGDLDIPACLDRRGEVCAHCGQPGGQPWDWHDGREVRLHPDCEDGWVDAQRNQRPRARAVVGSSR